MEKNVTVKKLMASSLKMLFSLTMNREVEICKNLVVKRGPSSRASVWRIPVAPRSES